MQDTDNWQFLLIVYAEHPQTALHLAQQFAVLKDFLQQGRKGRRSAAAELEQAIEVLFEHSNFGKVSRELFRQKLAGTLQPKQEKQLRDLGVEF